MHPLTVIVVLFGVFLHSEARHLERCELVRELRYQGFPEHELANWVCLVEHESSSNTHAIGTLNTDGSKDYGLFQINDRYWCNNGGWPGKECHVTCNELISDDISKAATCAKKIYGVHGFKAWYAWIAHCQGGLPDISHC